MKSFLCDKYVLIGIVLFCIFPIQAKEASIITVAKDGTGDFFTVQEAINSCRAYQVDEKTIFIKNGTYKEKVFIDNYLTHINIIGENKENTVITYDDHVGKEGIITFNSYTFRVLGENIRIENITVENSAGPVGQAVALHVDGDCCIINNCKITGNQDALYATGSNSRQYYRNCYIEGTTDFIFGAATAVFDTCVIHSKKDSYITAANTPENKGFGFVFRNCILEADSGVSKVFLGRPWREYAKTVFIYCTMGSHITPEGWHNWSDPKRELTTFYAEFNSNGPGANSEKRVKWSYQLSPEELKKYNLQHIFSYCSNWCINY